MLTTDEQKECKRLKISAKKYGGDDCYSWAVFVRGRPAMTGLGRSEVDYYKRQLIKTVSTSGR